MNLKTLKILRLLFFLLGLLSYFVVFYTIPDNNDRLFDVMFWVFMLFTMLFFISMMFYYGRKQGLSWNTIMSVLSFFWTIVAIYIVLDMHHDGNSYIFNYFLLYMSPILLFWLYRLIRYGASRKNLDRL